MRWSSVLVAMLGCAHAEVEADPRSAAGTVEPEEKPELREPDVLADPVCAGKPREPRVDQGFMCCYTPPEVFQRGVMAQRAAFTACYGELLGRNPVAAGRVSTRFSIAFDGTTRDACVTDSAIDDPVFLRCVAETFAGLLWPTTPPESPCADAVTISYPMLFAPE